VRRSSNIGFTLLELLIVITIFALMTTLVGVNLHGRERSDIESVARTLMTDLRYLRSRAMVNNIDTEMAFDVVAKRYVSQQAKIDRALPAAMSIKLTVDARDIAGSRAKIMFYPDGSSSGGEVHLSSRGRELEVATSWLNGYVTLR
jgi:general secretion pathway protein H